jgi:signal transduction histidine kinase
VSDGWEEALDAADAAIFTADVARGVATIAPPSVLGGDAPASYPLFLERLHPEDRDRVDLAIRDACAAPPGAKHEVELRLASGAWLAIVAKTGSDGSLRGLIKNHDEWRRLDDARLRSIYELSVSARSAEIFVSMVAHDLKSPLNVILGSARAAREGLPTPMLKASLERVYTNSERVARMLQHLREYARGRPGGFALERRAVDLRAVVENAITMIAPPAKPTLDVNGDVTGSWDPARLEHALLSLIDDAVTRSGSPASVRIAIDGTDARVRMTITTDAFTPPEAVDDAFRPFGGADAERGPSLFAARQAIVAHGGEVVLASTLKDGTSYEVSLPRAIKEPQGARMNAWDELAAVEGGTPLAVTESIFGSRPLYERAPTAYWRIFERYAALFDDALSRRIYRGESRTVSEETRALADALGALGAGANEVAELHGRALKQRLRDASSAKAGALVAEGRLLAFEVMGHLVTWYRKRAIIHVTEHQAPEDGVR